MSISCANKAGPTLCFVTAGPCEPLQRSYLLPAVCRNGVAQVLKREGWGSGEIVCAILQDSQHQVSVGIPANGDGGQ